RHFYLPLAAFASGAAALGLEVLWMRTFALVVGSSVYAFQLILASILLGIVAGTWLVRPLAARPWMRDPRVSLGGLLAVQGLAVVVQAAAFTFLPRAFLEWRKVVPPGFLLAQAGVFGLVFLSLLPLTLLQGLTFPLFLRLPGAGDAGRASGRLLAWNTA